jgi:NAD(P)-dependent dehydrogenase (short-subunit alcohol dehydrogenase family)
MSFEVSPYGASKAALNYAALAFAAELKPEDFTVVAIHPGVVQTDMLKSAEEAFDEQNLAWIKSVSITVENCADNLLDVFKNATKEISGKFLGNDGVEVPL